MAYVYASRRQNGRMPEAPARRMGSWKLAYADFLTALVALFLVLWLVKGLPDNGRADLAGFFRDGNDGDAQRALVFDSTPQIVLAEQLRASRTLLGHANRIRIETDGSQVRLDLVDRLDDPLFATGTSQLSASGIAALADIQSVLASGAWPVTIEGHTDAYRNGTSNDDNWALSTQRALAARDALLEAGLTSNRIRAVSGLADTRPINPGEPHLSANRRVTLVLHVSE